MSYCSILPAKIAFCRPDGHDLRLPAVFEKRLHRLANHDVGVAAAQAVGGAEPGEIQHGVEHAPDAHWRVAHARRGVRGDDDERHVHRGLIEQVAVLWLAVVAQSFAVVADDDDWRVDQPSAARTPRPAVRARRPWRRPRRGTAASRSASETDRQARTAHADRSSAPRAARGAEELASRYAIARSVVSRRRRSLRPTPISSSYTIEAAIEPEPA